MISFLDEIDDSREDVEMSLEDLLIFPNRDGLRRAMDKMASYFALEGYIVRKNIGSFTNDDFVTMILEKQERIAGIATDELNKHQQQPASTSTCCKSS